MSKILIIDDEKGVSYALSFFLGKKGYEVYSSADEKSGLAEIRDKKPDVVLLDLRLQGASGLEILKKIKKIDESIQVIILTGYGKVSSAVEAMKLGAYDYLTKPWKNERVIITIEKALKERELVREVEILKERLKEKDTLEFIGESVSIQCLKKELSRIVSTKVGVLLEGETGTGKEVIAKYIHFMSKRGKSPFVAVDCGALPKELIESELFGYEKGAFTGAEKRKLGKFELAAGGTLFLDEVGNLAPFAQEKLLRVLEEKEIHRLGGGGGGGIDIDVRIVAASNTSLAQKVEKGEFRIDLYHRLSQFPLRVPPLREREGDIELLSDHFLKKFAVEFNKGRVSLSPFAGQLMRNYGWPGNVRELINVIRRAVLVADGEIKPQHLLLGKIDEEDRNLKRRQAGGERSVIEEVLRKTGGKRDRTAESLGISRKTLYNKMKRLKMI